MQVFLDSLRGAIGIVLILVAFGLITYFVILIDVPPRDQIEAYYAARNRQVTVAFGGILMLVTLFGIVVFAVNLWRN